MNKGVVAFLFLTTALAGCLDLTGGNTVLIKEASNANGSKKATLFLRKSGATVANSYQVSVTEKDHTLGKSESGNIFTVDANHGATWLDSGSIGFFWLSNDTLRIDFDKKLRTFTQEPSVAGVTILYNPR